MTVQISDQQAAEFRLKGLPLRGTMVSGEDEEEEDYKLWPLDLRIVQSGTVSQTHFGPCLCTVFLLYCTRSQSHS